MVNVKPTFVYWSSNLLWINLAWRVVEVSFISCAVFSSEEKTGKKTVELQSKPCYLTGHWKLRDSVTTVELRNRRRFDKNLRNYFGFPRKFFRRDSKCGTNYTLPYSNLFPLCDEQGSKPCCNLDKGYCGADTASFCRCPNCIDPQTYLPAELAEWKPQDKNCIFKNFTQNTACELLNKNAQDIVFIGDCLMNHLFLGLAVILTNDALQGGLDKNLHPRQLKQCEGEYQFFDGGLYKCHQKSGSSWKSLGGNRTICNGRGTFNMSYTMAYDARPLMVMRAQEPIKRLLTKSGSYVILGIGHHVDFDSSIVQREYLDPLVNFVKKIGEGWPRMIWISIQSIDAFPRRINLDLNKRINAYNEDMKLYCNANGILFMDAFNLTSGIKSYDGIHFGFGAQITITQVLLNLLENYFMKNMSPSG